MLLDELLDLLCHGYRSVLRIGLTDPCDCPTELGQDLVAYIVLVLVLVTVFRPVDLDGDAMHRQSEIQMIPHYLTINKVLTPSASDLRGQPNGVFGPQRCPEDATEGPVELGLAWRLVHPLPTLPPHPCVPFRLCPPPPLRLLLPSDVATQPSTGRAVGPGDEGQVPPSRTCRSLGVVLPEALSLLTDLSHVPGDETLPRLTPVLGYAARRACPLVSRPEATLRPGRTADLPPLHLTEERLDISYRQPAVPHATPPGRCA